MNVHLLIASKQLSALAIKRAFSRLNRAVGTLSAASIVLTMAVLGASQAQAQMTTNFTTSGNQTWVCPTGVSSVQVEAWGGGGGSGGVGAHFASTGGGAGGSYVKYTVSVTPGNTYQLTVGAGGTAGVGGNASTGTSGGTGGSSYFGNTSPGNSSGASVLAVGGPGSVGNNTAGASTTNRTVTVGATATNSGNLPSSGATANTVGTNGATPVTNANNSGAGGAGAGPSGSSGGGAGGAALSSAGNGNVGIAPGGGGGGADQSSSSSNGTGGGGGVGQVALTYIPATPTINVTGTPTPVSTFSGTASTPTALTVSGSSLTANISLFAPTGFEFSTSVGSGYSSSLMLTQSSGTVAATPVYVRLTAADVAGSYSGNVSLSSPGATSVNKALPTCSVVTAFTQGNLAVEQLATSGTSSIFSIIELNSSTASQSSPVNTYFIPATVTTGALRQSNAGTTGRLSTSNDGTLVCFSGFVDAIGTTDETTVLSRSAASLGQSYQYSVQTPYTGISLNQTRGATYNNGIWYIADKGGVYLNGTSSPVSTTNIRPVKSFGGTVYALTQNTTTPAVIVQVSANGTTLTNLPGLPGDASATDFYMLSSGVNGSAFDLLYVLDGANITKYSLVSGTWAANGGATDLGITGDGLCAFSNGTGAYLYLSTGATNSVVKITDTAGYNAAPSINTANNVTLFTGSAGFLKGVAFAPLSAALPDLTIAAASVGTSNSFSYTLTVANSGAANATGVTANFTLPSGLTFISAMDNGSNGFNPTYSSGVVSFSGGTLNANSSDTLTVNVTGTGGATYVVDAGTSPAGGHGSAIINTSATTGSPIAESNSTNNGSDVSVSTTLGPPIINVTGMPTALSTTFGIASTPTSFSVSAGNLAANIFLTAPTGFEISTASGTGYAGSLALAESDGTVSETTIYLRLAAATTSGSYSGSVNLTSTGASTVNEAIPSSTVSPSAYLSGISLSSNSLTATLAATTTSYASYVPGNTSTITLTPTADTGATVTVNGASASNPVNLAVGANVITIVVTPSNGSSQTYTVTIYRAGPFSLGHLVVTVYGNIDTAPVHTDGQTTLITLAQFSPTIAANSTPEMAFALPSSVYNNGVGITGEYGTSSEGTIQPTNDGLYLTLGGYSAVPALAYTATALAQSPCATVPRVAALVDVNGNADTSSVFNDIYNTNNPRSVYSLDDVNFYCSGQGAGASDEGGLYFTQFGTNTTTGGAAPTGIFNVVSTRTVQAYEGNLYYSADQNSSSKGTQTGIFEYTGLPTTSQWASTGLRLTPANNGSGVNYSPQGFYFANATTLYVADTGDPKAGGTGDGGIQKWAFNGSQWVLEYTMTNPSFVSPFPCHYGGSRRDRL